MAAKSPIAGVWKPGTSRPSSSSQTPPPPKSASKTPNTKNDKDKTPSKSSGKKRLSGSTMGMRFMQKSSHKKRSEPSKDASSSPVATRQSDGDNKSTNAGGTPSPSIRGEMHQWRSNDEDTIMKDMDDTTTHRHQPTVPNNQNIPQYATAVDMYGLGARIAGRRSFGGFNKKVEETYRESLDKATLQQKGETKRGDMSDAEIRRQYDQYLERTRGGGAGCDDDEEEIDEAAAAPIGNLKEKIKGGNKKRRL